jgi:predicted DNA-binding transcriptional regulator AlpA
MGAVKEIPELISASEIVSYTNESERNFKDRTSKRPDFPAAIKIGKTRQWVKSEFVEWFMSQREG